MFQPIRTDPPPDQVRRISDYAADPAAGHPAAAETLTTLGFRCAGQTSGGRPARPIAPTAWITAP